MPSSTTKGVPYPIGTDAAALLDTIVQSLADWVDAQPGIMSVTTAEMNALAGDDLWVGRVVYNNQTLRLMVYNGTAWVLTTNIEDGSVSTNKLVDGAVTDAKAGAPSTGSLGTIKYARFGKIVHVWTTSASSAPGSPLPAGFRPAAPFVGTVGFATNQVSSLMISTAGVITYSLEGAGADGWFSVSFSTV